MSGFTSAWVLLGCLQMGDGYGFWVTYLRVIGEIVVCGLGGLGVDVVARFGGF